MPIGWNGPGGQQLGSQMASYGSQAASGNNFQSPWAPQQTLSNGLSQAGAQTASAPNKNWGAALGQGLANAGNRGTSGWGNMGSFNMPPVQGMQNLAPPQQPWFGALGSSLANAGMHYAQSPWETALAGALAHGGTMQQPASPLAQLLAMLQFGGTSAQQNWQSALAGALARGGMLRL